MEDGPGVRISVGGSGILVSDAGEVGGSVGTGRGRLNAELRSPPVKLLESLGM